MYDSLDTSALSVKALAFSKHYFGATESELRVEYNDGFIRYREFSPLGKPHAITVHCFDNKSIEHEVIQPGVLNGTRCLEVMRHGADVRVFYVFI